MRNSLTLLDNSCGDVTVGWDEENDETFIALIEKKMAEGMTFYTIEPRLFGLIPMKTKLKSSEDALKQRTVIVSDSDFNDIILSGKAQTYKRESGGEIVRTGILKAAKEAVNQHVIGITQRVGG